MHINIACSKSHYTSTMNLRLLNADDESLLETFLAARSARSRKNSLTPSARAVDPNRRVLMRQ
jgi:hypothetical protein